MAILVPCKFRAMQLKTPSWAGMSTGGFSVFARSTICTCPVCVPGNASKELLLFGHRTQRPKNTMQTFWKTSTFTTTSLFTDRYQRLRHKKNSAGSYQMTISSSFLTLTVAPLQKAHKTIYLDTQLFFKAKFKVLSWNTHLYILHEKADSCINLAKKWCSDKPFK